MFFKEETKVEETVITQTFSMEESNMRKAKLKMDEVREENERLKLALSQILKDYNSLKKQFIKTQEEEEEDDNESKKATNIASMAASASVSTSDDEESDMVSLSLGRRFSKDSRKEEAKRIDTSRYRESKTLENGGIELGLSCKHLDSEKSLETSRSFDESKEEVRSSPSHKHSRSGDDEILQQNPLTKKTRVSVRAVCNTQTMQDGCQWRKYGQKIAKGNPCPRAYYRCTVSSSCPVRKQVQRSIDDMSVLITTYEGSHNHSLPPSAAGMASATSAAAAMLSSGSTTSSSSPSNPNNPFGYNFNSKNYPRATISSSQSHPTVVLDLTAPNHGNRFPSSMFSAAHSSPKSFNFSSNFDRNDALQIGWDPRFPSTSSANAALFSGVQTLQRQAANDQKIAAATTAITHDPNFRSALAAAITSFVGNNNSSSNVGGRNSGMDFHLNFSQPKSRALSLADEGEQIKL